MSHVFAASKEFVIITKRKGLAAAGMVALIAAGSAACGTAEATPQGKVQNAFTKLSDGKSLTLGVSFDGSADQIYAALKDEDDFTRADAALIASLHADLAVSSDKPLGEVTSGDKGGAFGFRLSNDDSGDTALVEVRSVDRKLYLRADIKGLEKLDTSPSASGDVQEFNRFLDQADQLPASLGSVKAALKGRWISLDPKAFAEFGKSFAQKMGAGTGTSGIPGVPATPKVDAATQRQVADALKAALAHNAKYTDLGSKDGADHVKVTVPARQFATDAWKALTPVLKQIPGYKPLDPTDVPNRAFAVDVALKGGKVSRLTFDLAQLDTGAHGKLPLALAFDGDAEQVTAPEGAEQLNPQDIVGLLMSGNIPGLGDPSSADGLDS